MTLELTCQDTLLELERIICKEGLSKEESVCCPVWERARLPSVGMTGVPFLGGLEKQVERQ